jgi:hypothetical protein
MFQRKPQPESQERCFAPHCDQSVLHSPESGCIYCSKYPDWQELRIRWRINFSGENDPNKAPCPSTHFRSEDTINRWHGNIPMTKEQQEKDDEYWATFRKAIADLIP